MATCVVLAPMPQGIVIIALQAPV